MPTSVEIIHNGEPRLDASDHLLKLETFEDWLIGRCSNIVLENRLPLGSKATDELPFFKTPFLMGDVIEVVVDGTRLMKGFVRGLEGIYESGTHPCLRLYVGSELERLAADERSELHQELGLSDLVESACSRCGLQLDWKGGSGLMETLAQESETDYDLLTDLLVESDLYWYINDEDWLVVAKRHVSPPSSLTLNPKRKLKSFRAVADVGGMATEVKSELMDESTGSPVRVSVSANSLPNRSSGSNAGPAAAEFVFGPCLHSWPGGRMGYSHLQEGAVSVFRQICRQFILGEGECVFSPSMQVGSRLRFSGLGGPYDGVAFVSEVRHCYDRDQGWRTYFDCEFSESGLFHKKKLAKPKVRRARATRSPSTSSRIVSNRRTRSVRPSGFGNVNPAN
ncbi:hypothetical protein [Pelagicoccus albus]|uniref:Phage protein D n=1 Tax=Pelagicoccus albus TaxID=415222 RepID=A0A7X1E8L6_9BACT|nr:hypothetical protein [Pelagicoccus albus]MBC2604912.1 hypothetical protein [Pelagicoccus albus]